MVLGRDQPGLVVDPVVVRPVDDQAGQPPARRLVGELALDGAAADERAIVVGQVADHPAPAELDRRRAVLVGPAVADWTRSRHRGAAARPRSGACPARRARTAGRRSPSIDVPQRVPDLERVRCCGPRSRSPGRRCSRSATRSPGSPRCSPSSRPKNGIVRHARDERREQVARPRTLDGEDAVVVADLLDRDVVAAPDEVLEVGEVGFGGGQQELVGGRAGG